MLYVTTRSDREVFTAQRVLCENRGSDGGLFVPFRDPDITPQRLSELEAMRFSDCVAEILNLLFQCHLTGWDVDFCAGRHGIRLQQLNQRILLAECWHNTAGLFSDTVLHLTRLITSEPACVPGPWAAIGVRIAVLFGIYGELSRSGMASYEQPFDVSVVSGDFSAPISCWYARKWGLPIGNIVCCCNENGDIWNLFCHGQLRTDSVAKTTQTPQADIAVPEHLEQLIYAAGGTDAVNSYLEAVRLGKTYYLDDKYFTDFRRGMYVTVVGQRRMSDTVVSFFGTNRCVLSPYAALACAGLQDYRSQAGESRFGLVISERSPLCECQVVAQSLGIAPDQLGNYL